jgi:MFS family permease
VSTYLDILRAPRMAALMAVALLVRLPIGINGLAVVLFLREETGTFSVAGAVAGGLALGTGVGAPFMGRLVDRVGTGVLVPLAFANATALVALVVLGSADTPAPALVTAVLAGALVPPNPSVLRARFPDLLGHDPRLVASVYALDSVLLEVGFVLGPLLVAVFVAAAEPQAAIVFSAAAVLTGSLLFAALLPPPPAARVARDRSGDGLLGALRAPGIQTLVLTMFPVGVAIGALEVAVPAFSRQEGAAEAAGVLLAVWSVGSAAGGLVYGARPRRGSLAAVHLRLTYLLPLAFVPVLAATSLPLMAVLLLPAGMLIAPIIATRNELASAAAPPGTATEALTWPLTALLSGLATGAAVGGALIDANGWRAAVVAAVVGAAAGSLLATTRRRTLRAATASA